VFLWKQKPLDTAAFKHLFAKSGLIPRRKLVCRKFARKLCALCGGSNKDAKLVCALAVGNLIFKILLQTLPGSKTKFAL
jgi:hypothetical protein